METSNKNFQCETGAHQLSMTEGRDVAAQKILGYFTHSWHYMARGQKNKLKDSICTRSNFPNWS